MIGKLTGIFSGYYGNNVIIDVNEIGYEVLMKSDDIATMIVGDKITLYIKEIIKEDDYILYGFLSFEEKCWFEELIKISGLGPKSALAILSSNSCDDISSAIKANDCDFFESISGIGGKIANRIPKEMNKNIEKINEKINSFPSFNNKEKNLFEDKTKENKNVKNENKDVIDNAVKVLFGFGFSKQESYKDVYEIAKQFEKPTEEDLVRIFLKKKDNSN